MGTQVFYYFLKLYIAIIELSELDVKYLKADVNFITPMKVMKVSTSIFVVALNL